MGHKSLEKVLRGREKVSGADKKVRGAGNMVILDGNMNREAKNTVGLDQIPNPSHKT